MRLRSLLILCSLGLAAETAHAATCSFDEGSGVLSVDTQGGRGDLEAAPGGAILLNGVACGSATTSTTARIVVSGIDNSVESISFLGTFAPGRNDVPETDTPEIEIVVGYTDLNDVVAVYGDASAQVWRFTAEGVNLNGDLDEDLTLPPTGNFRLFGLGGNDVIDASGYARVCARNDTGTCTLRLYGGAGADLLTGSPGGDGLYGNGGNDTLTGGAGEDLIVDGPGADTVMGGPDADYLRAAASADPGDDYRGGGGIDTVSYLSRQNGVTVTIDNVANDGESGENDNVHLDVEGVTGGDGDDVLVGSGAGNFLAGGLAGNDELYGGDGADHLDGFDGDDLLMGDAGDDVLTGFGGNDILDGGAGVDEYRGGEGDDLFINADGLAETIDCGNGIDDPEPDPLDTFIACENI